MPRFPSGVVRAVVEAAAVMATVMVTTAGRVACPSATFHLACLRLAGDAEACQHK